MDLITVKEAIREYGVSRTSIFRWLADGSLTRYRRKGQKAIMIDRRQLKRILSPQPEKRG